MPYVMPFIAKKPFVRVSSGDLFRARPGIADAVDSLDINAWAHDRQLCTAYEMWKVKKGLIDPIRDMGAEVHVIGNRSNGQYLLECAKHELKNKGITYDGSCRVRSTEYSDSMTWWDYAPKNLMKEDVLAHLSKNPHVVIVLDSTSYRYRYNVPTGRIPHAYLGYRNYFNRDLPHYEFAYWHESSLYSWNGQSCTGPINRSDLFRVVTENRQVDGLWDELVKGKYIDEEGGILERTRQSDDPDDLELTDAYFGLRTDVLIMLQQAGTYKVTALDEVAAPVMIFANTALSAEQVDPVFLRYLRGMQTYRRAAFDNMRELFDAQRGLFRSNSIPVSPERYYYEVVKAIMSQPAPEILRLS